MRVKLLLLANDLYHPLGHRIRELLPYLTERIHVDVVSLVPPGLSCDGLHAPTGALLRGWPRRVLKERSPLSWTHHGAKLVRRAPLPGALGPLANLFLLKRALRSADLSQYQLALAQGPVPGRTLVGGAAPFVYDHADNYRGGRVDVTHRRLLGRWQERSIRTAVAVSCAGHALRAHAEQLHAPQVALFPNGVHTRRFAIPRRESQDPRLLYVGGLEVDCGLDLVIRALAMMNPRPTLTIAGSGPSADTFRKLAATHDVSSSIEWLGPVPAEQLPPLLADAWVGLAFFADTDWNRYAFHLKVLEYMAAGLPFITTAVGDATILARKSGAGLVTKSAPETLASALSMLLTAKEKRAEMSEKGRKAAKEYDWAVIGPRFAEWLLAQMELRRKAKC